MGLLLSRLIRKRASTRELLENIEKELENIEEFRFYTQQRQKRMVGSLIVYSIIAYIILSVIFYFYYFPTELPKQILCSLLLIIFPVIIWLIKKLVHWYYMYKLSQNDDQIMLLHREKKKLLKEVMEKETYKVAKEILEKYDPEHSQKKLISAVLPPYSSSDISKVPEMEIRKRASIGVIRTPPISSVRPMGPTIQSVGRPVAPIIKPGYNAPPAPFPKAPPVRPSGIPMPCPIFPQQRGVFDRMVEYIVGDGPNNRYALICRQCHSHNGMALREEFEFIAFRCCYCYSYNPARKQRPMAPRLSLQLPLPVDKEQSVDRTSSSTDDSANEGATESIAEDDSEHKDVVLESGASSPNEENDMQIVKPSDSDDIGTCDTENAELVMSSEPSEQIAAPCVIACADEEPSNIDNDEELRPDDVSSNDVPAEEPPASLPPS